MDRYTIAFYGGQQGVTSSAKKDKLLLFGATKYHFHQHNNKIVPLPDLIGGELERDELLQQFTVVDNELDSPDAYSTLHERGKNGALLSYQYLHLIGHAGVNINGEAQIYWPDHKEQTVTHLGAEQIAEWQLNAELVFLSACSTGEGKAFAGWGIDSLGQSFLRAGAKSVIATLWSVNDRSTAIISREIYKLLPKLGLEVALSQVQRNCRKGLYGEQLQHLYYWSGLSCWVKM